MAETNAVVRVYDPHPEAELTIKELQRSGFDMSQLSIVGKDYHTEERAIGYYNAGDRMKVWGEMASFWGGLSGLLFGSGFFFTPGVYNSNTLLYLDRTDSNAKLFLARNNSNAIMGLADTVRTDSNAFAYGIKNNSNALLAIDTENNLGRY